MRGLIIIALLAGPAVFAQLPDSSTVELTGQQLLWKQDWHALLKHGIEARRAGFDHPALEVRTGLAAFKLGRFSTAEGILKRTLKEDPQNVDARDILFGALWNQGYTLEANDAARLLPDSLRKRYAPVLKNGLKGIGLMVGIKGSADQDLAGDLPFGELNASYQLTPRMLLDAGLLASDQQRYWGDIRHYTGWLGSTHYLGRGLYLMPNVLGFQSAGAIDTYSERRTHAEAVVPIGGGNANVTTDSTITAVGRGSYTQTGVVPVLSALWRTRRLSLLAGGSYATSTLTNRVDHTDEITSTRMAVRDGLTLFSEQNDTTLHYLTEADSTSYYTQANFDVSYVPPILGDRLRLGAGAAMVADRGAWREAYTGSLSFRLGKRTWLSADYLMNRAELLVEQNGRLLQNSIDQLDQRTGIGITHWLGDRWRLDIRFQQEHFTDRFLDLPYTYNTGLLSIRFTP